MLSDGSGSDVDDETETLVEMKLPDAGAVAVTTIDEFAAEARRALPQETVWPELVHDQLGAEAEANVNDASS